MRVSERSRLVVWSQRERPTSRRLVTRPDPKPFVQPAHASPAADNRLHPVQGCWAADSPPQQRRESSRAAPAQVPAPQIGTRARVDRIDADRAAGPRIAREPMEWTEWRRPHDCNARRAGACRPPSGPTGPDDERTGAGSVGRRLLRQDRAGPTARRRRAAFVPSRRRAGPRVEPCNQAIGEVLPPAARTFVRRPQFEPSRLFARWLAGA